MITGSEVGMASSAAAENASTSVSAEALFSIVMRALLSDAEDILDAAHVTLICIGIYRPNVIMLATWFMKLSRVSTKATPVWHSEAT